MNNAINNTEPVLLVGDAGLIAGTAVCLLSSGHYLNVCTPDIAAFSDIVNKHLAAQNKIDAYRTKLSVDNVLTTHHDCKLVIAITSESAATKQALLKDLAPVIAPNAIVAINTESTPLDTLQSGFAHPDRLIGLNWTEPAHTTLFFGSYFNRY